ncbi:hypothetical protein KBA73_02920 [Patescibacteria group bacterium]|nr:hypothetical protein [Patescibacteria group bacterium]
MSFNAELGKDPDRQGASSYEQSFKHEKHPFDDALAKQAVSVMKKWAQYGEGLYDHLTGKAINLEKGVDYQMLSDGRVDLVGYKAARQKKIDGWLQEPGNRAWLAAGKKFDQEYSQSITDQREKVMVRTPQGTREEKSRYTRPLSREQGWLYFDSNYFHKSRGEMTQPNRESTRYRVYVQVDGKDVISTYESLIKELMADPGMQKVGMQIKTADLDRIGGHELGQLLNQRDRIVLYLGEEGMKYALPILRRYAKRHSGLLQQEGVLFAQPIKDSDGADVPGMRITSETKGESPDPAEFPKEYKSFSKMQSQILESCLRSIIAALKDPGISAQLAATYPRMKEALSKLLPKSTIQQHVRAIFADPHGEEFLIKNLKVIYPQWAASFGMSPENVAFKKT